MTSQSPRKCLLAPSMVPSTGASREGLHSTFRRICEKNQLSVGDVYAGIMAPQIEARKDRLAVMSNAAYFFDRGCSTSHRLIAKVQELTKLENLLQLTLAELTGLRGIGSLAVSHTRKWCGECYESDAESDVGAFDRLLWSINNVQACPLHRTQLQSVCSACGDGPFPILSGRDISGRCPKCLAWLGGFSVPLNESKDDHSLYLYWTAKSFADLLDTPISRDIDARAGFIKVLKSLSIEHFNGVYAHLASAIARNKSVISTWFAGRAAPSWEALCEISFVFQIPISEMLLGQTDAVAISTIRHLPSTVAKRLTQPRKLPEKRRPSDLQDLLTAVENGEITSLRSMSAIANRLGIHPREFYRLAPERAKPVAKLLAKRRSATRAIKQSAREWALRETIPRIVSDLINRSEGVTRRNVDKELAIAGLPVNHSESAFIRELVQTAIANASVISGN